jgi:hypothetical protein
MIFGMTSITPLFADIFLKADFFALLTEAVNGGFIPMAFALDMTEAAGASPSKTKIKLSPAFTSLAALRDTASMLRDIKTTYAPRTVMLDPAIERALDKMENSHAL